MTILLEVVEMMKSLGLYLMYDMRWTYQNLTAVEEEVNRIKSYDNVLLWYTADEPDGFQDPFTSTNGARDKIEEIDGWHPISLASLT
jgi:hypothetical protein